jgi:hypothetical protein
VSIGALAIRRLPERRILPAPEMEASMPSYVFTYRTRKDYAPSSDTMEAWKGFFDGLGSHLVALGNPTFARRAIGAEPAKTVLGGYSIVEADDLDAAVALASGCPTLQHGGGVEVGELTVLDRD